MTEPRPGLVAALDQEQADVAAYLAERVPALAEHLKKGKNSALFLTALCVAHDIVLADLPHLRAAGWCSYLEELGERA